MIDKVARWRFAKLGCQVGKALSDFSPAAAHIGLIEDNVGLIVSDLEDFDQFKELLVTPKLLLSHSEADHLRRRAQGLQAVVEEDQAEDVV